MKKHIIPENGFFTKSPEIHIRRHPAVEEAVREAMEWIEQQTEKGGRMNCQTRPSSDEERDGHLTRLLGVKRMNAMFLEVKDKTEYWSVYHKKKRPWPAAYAHDEHPCVMLSNNDKWYMWWWDDHHLKSYGQENKAKYSCVPQEMVGEHGPVYYKFAVENCKYYNGEYDGKVLAALNRPKLRADAEQ